MNVKFDGYKPCNKEAGYITDCKVANLPCVVFTTPNVSPIMKTLMQAFGAYVFVTPTMDDRLVIMDKLVHELGYAPASGMWTPPIGSHFRGVDGYKTISFEVFEQMGTVPDWFIVPCSYGDTLYGIYKGMCDLKEMGYVAQSPKMVAAEVFGATKKSVESDGDIPIEVSTQPSIQTSIATGTTTYQTVKAIRKSGGTSVISSDEEALSMQQLLAYTEGVLAEPSSLASLVAVKNMVQEGKISRNEKQEGKISRNEKVVVLITSEGIKDPDTVVSRFSAIPSIEPTLDAFYSAMQQSYYLDVNKVTN